MTKIIHEYTVGEIVCPHCGYSYNDTDFRIDDHMEGIEICEGCWKEFNFEAFIEISWTTSKTDNKPVEQTGESCASASNSDKREATT